MTFKDFLTKLKLRFYLDLELEIEKERFVKSLKSRVDLGSLSNFYDIFDQFISSKNKYKGTVNLNAFQIKNRKKLFEFKLNQTIAKGQFFQKDSRLQIFTEISGFRMIFIPFYVVLPLIYVFAIGTLITVDEMDLGKRVSALLFILFHAGVLLGLPYYLIRRETMLMAKELEKLFKDIANGL